MKQISNEFSGTFICLDKSNVDTDQIIPKQFLKSIKKTGFGDNLFDGWRYLDEGTIDQETSSRMVNKDFIFNNKLFADSNILVSGLKKPINEHAIIIRVIEIADAIGRALPMNLQSSRNA